MFLVAEERSQGPADDDVRVFQQRCTINTVIRIRQTVLFELSFSRRPKIVATPTAIPTATLTTEPGTSRRRCFFSLAEAHNRLEERLQRTLGPCRQCFFLGRRRFFQQQTRTGIISMAQPMTFLSLFQQQTHRDYQHCPADDVSFIFSAADGSQHPTKA